MKPNPRVDAGGDAPAGEAAIEAAALRWLVRRDRGLTEAETQDFNAWLRAESRHAQAVAKLAALWSSMDQLQALAARSGSEPDPDLLARPSRPARWRWPVLVAVAAAGLAVIWALVPPIKPVAPAVAVSAPSALAHRLTLADGSVVELGPGSRIEEHFTVTERRVQLVQGEATFHVMKNPHRPFVVSAGFLSVRAVGTIFEVRLAPTQVHVSVSEGKVWAGPDWNGRELGAGMISADRFIVAGQAADFSSAVLEASLDLVFSGEPLANVVAQLNRHNRIQLVIRDPATAALRIGGRIRADNEAGFLRLLDSSFGVKAQAQGDDELVLSKSK